MLADIFGADLIPWVSYAVQLHCPGEDGTLAITTGVVGHFLHSDTRFRESKTGEVSIIFREMIAVWLP